MLRVEMRHIFEHSITRRISLMRFLLIHLSLLLFFLSGGAVAVHAADQTYTKHIGMADSAQDTENTYKNYIASFNNDTSSLVGYVESNNSIFVLSSKVISDNNFRLDPDNVRSYNATILVTKICNRQIVAQAEIAQLFGGSKNDNSYHSIKRGAIDIVNDHITIFFSEKSARRNSYGQNGYIYSIDPINLKFSVKNIFNQKNWGWFPYFDRDGNLLHFSFNGYFMYKNNAVRLT
jgi:hypothetical protein